MLIRTTDFNGVDVLLSTGHATQWNDLAESLAALKLHLKPSDQAGKRGSPIFDAVGSNAAIKTELVARGWASNIPISADLSFLGTDVDFVKTGVLVEVQFSNYPFLLNNLLRSELFFKGGAPLAGSKIDAAVIIAKAKMFDASNSTLYYEQAVNQLTALAANDVFSVPLRLVGLFEDYGAAVPVVWTNYAAPRYSRTVGTRHTAMASIRPGSRATSRAVITILP